MCVDDTNRLNMCLTDSILREVAMCVDDNNRLNMCLTDSVLERFQSAHNTKGINSYLS